MNPSKWLKVVIDPHSAILALERRFHSAQLERIKRRLPLVEERDRCLRFLSEAFCCDAAGFLEDLRASEFTGEFEEKLKVLARKGAHPGTSSRFDCETLYLVVRAARPRVAVETGVLYGAFSGHILEAMEQNGFGRLVSLDLPSRVPNDFPKDFLIRELHRERQRLVLGDTRHTLMPVLQEEGSIDLFNHDSLHTFDHMMWEYLLAHRFLAPGGVLTSHDVLASRHHASPFQVFVEGLGYCGGTFRNFGVARKPSDRSGP